MGDEPPSAEESENIMYPFPGCVTRKATHRKMTVMRVKETNIFNSPLWKLFALLILPNNQSYSTQKNSFLYNSSLHLPKMGSSKSHESQSLSQGELHSPAGTVTSILDILDPAK